MTLAPAARATQAFEYVLVAVPMRPHTGAYCCVQTIGRRGSGVNWDISVSADLGLPLTGVTDEGEVEATNTASAAANAVVMAISPNEIRAFLARGAFQPDNDFDGRFESF